MSSRLVLIDHDQSDRRNVMLHVGRHAWALLGGVALLVLAWLVIVQLSVVVVPLVLALFPATVLAPVVRWMVRRRVPKALAALLALLGGLVLVVGLVAAVVPVFLTQLPALGESITDSAQRLQPLVDRLPGVASGTPLQDLAERATTGLVGGDAMQTAIGATQGAVEVLSATLLLLVALFFYLAKGERMVGAAIGTLPRRHHQPARELAGQLWDTVGGFFRSQCVVAVADAVLIGIGLALLGVPLALPLAVLVFVGGFFPIIGAAASGLLAVLVALADGGLGLALATLALVLAVQVVEGNLLQPLIAGQALRLPAFAIILAVAVGGTLLGVLGAFLAVPAAAALVRVGHFLQQQRQEDKNSGR